MTRTAAALAAMPLSRSCHLTIKSRALGLRSSPVAALPEHPPAAWFSMPEPDGPRPLVVTDEGQVHGHILVPGTQWPAYRMRGDTFEHFHRHPVLTDDGTTIEAGCIRVSTEHAAFGLSWREAIAHYDASGTAAAAVRAIEGVHGLWLAGAVWPGSSREAVHALRRSWISGAWWRIDGVLCLIAAIDLRPDDEHGGFLTFERQDLLPPIADPSGPRSQRPPARSGTPVRVLITHGLPSAAADLLAEVFGSAENLVASLARHADGLCGGIPANCPWDQFPGPAEHLGQADDAARAWCAVGWLERGLGSDQPIKGSEWC